MGIEKSEIKKAAAHEIGMKLDDMLSSAEKDEAVLGGGKAALVQAASKLDDLILHNLNADEKEGKLTPEQYALVKGWLNRAAGVVRNLATAAEVNQHVARGRVVAYKQSVDVVKKVYDLEKAKIEALQAPPDTTVEGVDRRQPGQHPGDPLKQRRRRANLKSIPAPPLEPHPEKPAPPESA